jgi:hypothetical protein
MRLDGISKPHAVETEYVEGRIVRIATHNLNR